MEELFTQFWQSHSTTIVTLGYRIVLAVVIYLASSFIAKAVRKAILNTNSKLHLLQLFRRVHQFI